MNALTLVAAREDARAARLRYVTDDTPGIRRLGSPKRFRYVDVAGKAVRDRETRARIVALAIPPAWTSVWICPLSHGHVQATGRDAKGRKQYRYHARWRVERDTHKYERTLEFGAALPRIRANVVQHLALGGLPREKVLATVIRLLELTCIRVGNEEYARDNASFGLTTLRGRHVEIEGNLVQFSFRGKSGKDHSIGVKDARLARIVRACDDLPGRRLFEYLDEEGRAHAVDSNDVNDYIREIAGDTFSAKDFRTFAGTLLAARIFRTMPVPASVTESKRAVNEALGVVAERLGNTVAVCRKCYVHPAVIQAFEAGALQDRRTGVQRSPGQEREEAALMRLIRKVTAKTASVPARKLRKAS